MHYLINNPMEGKMKKFFACALCFLSLSILFPPAVRAATVKNADNKPHSLVVKRGGDSFQVVIDSNGTIKDLCAFCTIEVVGFSLLDIENEPMLVIRDGVLSVQK